MTRLGTSTAGTRAAHAALARLTVPELECDRYLLVDDSDEDATQILTVLTERSCFARGTSPEVQS
jgi:hypothetical protein